jgi:hypothetical protein
MNQRLSEAPSWHALQVHYEKIRDSNCGSCLPVLDQHADRALSQFAWLSLAISCSRYFGN